MVYKKTAISFTQLSFILIFAIAIAAWTTIFIQGDTGFLDLFISQTWSNASRFASNMVGSNYSETPAFLLLDRWMATGILAYETLCMSIIAIFISGLLAITTMLPAARNIYRTTLFVYGRHILLHSTPKLCVFPCCTRIDMGSDNSIFLIPWSTSRSFSTSTT